MKHTKIAIIGAGAVGATTAYALMIRNLTAEIMLIDIDEKRCEGEILDLSDALSFCRASKIKRGTIEDARKSNIIIISAGKAQKPGETRADLASTNKKVIKSIIYNLKPINKNAIIIMVTNPLDVLTLIAQEESGLPKEKVFGTGTFLDTQRIRGLISKKLNIAEQSIHAYVLGEHGDTQFAAWDCASIAGAPLSYFPQLDPDTLNKFEKETREKAYEIIKCKGATFFGIATCVSAICENIIFDQKRTLPLSVFIKEFGICLSMPVILGCGGIEKILDIPLSEKEKKLLKASAEKIKNII